jgi:hypothetical protein
MTALVVFRPVASRLLWAVLLVVMSRFAYAKDILPEVGDEQQVAVQNAGAQISPAIAADARGNYVVAWLGPDQQLVRRVYLRLFSASGAPYTGDIRVDEAAGPFEIVHGLRVAMAPSGKFVVLWWGIDDAWARLYSAQGEALGERFRPNDQSLVGNSEPDVAMDADDEFTVTWIGAGLRAALYARSFGADGRPLEASKRIDGAAAGTLAQPRVAATAPGGFVVVWARRKTGQPLFSPESQVVASLRTSVGAEWSPEIELVAFHDSRIDWIRIVALPDGGFSIIWTGGQEAPPPNFPLGVQLIGRRFDAVGGAATPPRLLPFSYRVEGFFAPAVAVDSHGNTLAIAAYESETRLRLEGRLFDRAWNQVGATVQIASDVGDQQREPAVAGASGGFVASWVSQNRDGDGPGVFAQRFGAPLCVEGSTVLCLGADGRFEASVDWRTPLGTQGRGRAHPLTSDSGTFWFFEPNNLELMTKILDGTAVNGRFWVFSAALSDVEYTLAVLDTRTGVRWSYANPQGTLASRADIEAFPGTNDSSSPAGSASAALKAHPFGPCGDSALCLLPAASLLVTVEFVDPRTGTSARARAIPLTDNTGAFSFFDSGNLELIVKALDGGVVNGKIWFFYGGLSDVEYTITVEDIAGHRVARYTNQRGHLESKADTQALPSPVFP